MEETERKQPICRKSLTNFITCIEYCSPWVVIGTDCTGSCKSNYHMATTALIYIGKYLLATHVWIRWIKDVTLIYVVEDRLSELLFFGNVSSNHYISGIRNTVALTSTKLDFKIFESEFCKCSGRRVWRYQRGNQNPYIEEKQKTQWLKEKKVQKDKQRSTNTLFLEMYLIIVHFYNQKYNSRGKYLDDFQIYYIAVGRGFRMSSFDG